MSDCSFTLRVFEYIHQSGVLTALFGGYMVGATRNCCHLGAHSVHATQPRTKFTVLFEATSIRSWRAQELCESRGGFPGLPAPNSLNGFCGRKAL